MKTWIIAALAATTAFVSTSAEAAISMADRNIGYTGAINYHVEGWGAYPTTITFFAENQTPDPVKIEVRFSWLQPAFHPRQCGGIGQPACFAYPASNYDYFMISGPLSSVSLFASLPHYGFSLGSPATLTVKVIGEGIAMLSNIKVDGAYSVDDFSTPVPEPATWGMMLIGFGAAGAAMRRRNVKVAFA